MEFFGIFSVSGAFAGISYTDLLGKIFRRPQRMQRWFLEKLVF